MCSREDLTTVLAWSRDGKSVHIYERWVSSLSVEWTLIFALMAFIVCMVCADLLDQHACFCGEVLEPKAAIEIDAPH